MPQQGETVKMPDADNVLEKPLFFSHPKLEDQEMEEHNIKNPISKDDLKPLFFNHDDEVESQDESEDVSMERTEIPDGKSRFFTKQQSPKPITKARSTPTPDVEIIDLDFSDGEGEIIKPIAEVEDSKVTNIKFVRFASYISSIFPGIKREGTSMLFEKFKNESNANDLAVDYYLQNRNVVDNHKIPTRQRKISDFITVIDEEEETNEKSELQYDRRKKQKLRKQLRLTSHNSTKNIGLVTDRKYMFSWKRYIGSLSVDAWCTRTVFGTYLSRHQHVYLSNSSLHGSSSNNLSSSHNSKKVLPKREDTNVYVFDTENNKMLGKVSTQYGDVIRPLLSDDLVEFKARIASCKPGRPSLGDSFILEVDCFLSSEVFQEPHDSGIDKSLEQLLKDHKKTEKPGKQEIESIFQKQVNFQRLFKEINFLSEHEKEERKFKQAAQNKDKESTDHNIYTTNEDGTLEIIEGNEVEPEKSLDSTDGGGLTLNQLRDIYSTAQSNLLDTKLPETTPKNVKLELRPYQKQGLSWMLDRESKQELIDKEDSSALFGSNQHNPLWKEYRWPTRKRPFSANIDSSHPEYDFTDEDFESPERTEGSVEEEEDIDLLPKTKFYYNFFTGEFSFKRPLISLARKGGILADEMGLGKTISTLSLILTAPEDLSYKDSHGARVNSDVSSTNHEPILIDDDSLPYAYRTTLIVVPMALLAQWESEFHKANSNSANKCFIYYGNSSVMNISRILRGPDAPIVVITTYGTIQAEFARQGMHKSDGLYSVKFHRIVLDEGHTIRNKSTKTSKAITSLKGSNKWVLSGTPIMNKLDDLYSMINFLDLSPWKVYPLWKFYITNPFDSGKDIVQAFSLLKTIITPILLRRTKNQRDHEGKLLVELLPKKVIIERLKFNEKEEAIYNWLMDKAFIIFKRNMSNNLFKAYSTILTQILRLRQVCCHVDLVKRVDNQLAEEENIQGAQLQLEGEAFSEVSKILNRIEEKEKSQRISPETMLKLKNEIYDLYPDFSDIECSICTSEIEIDTCIITECKHCFCLNCLIDHFNYQDTHNPKTPEEGEQPNSNEPSIIEKSHVYCPMCRTEIKKSRLFRTFKSQFRNKIMDVDDSFDAGSYLTQAASDQKEEREYYIRPFNPYGKSTKINALISHLHQINEEEPGDRVIVFSQFTSFLSLIKSELDKYEEFKTMVFDGKLSADQRSEVLNRFNNKDKNEDKREESKLKILLISLKAGGVGLNLTVASKAFLLDPHWNAAMENQAIDRIHRIGQQRNVKVIRFVMENSIEEKMLKIQERKTQLGDALTMTDDERRKKRIEDIKILFSK